MKLAWGSLSWVEDLKRFSRSVPIGLIGLYFGATRLLIVLLGALSAQVIRPGDFEHRGHLIDMFARWDAGWYLGIAANGYSYSETAPSSVAFFPLYPLLVRLGTFVLGDPRVSGYVISNLGLFASCVVIWKLVARDYGSAAAADRAVLFLLLEPVSFFFSTIYTESVYLFLLVSLAYFAAGRRWLAAGICGFFLALTKSSGILVVILLVAELVMQLHRRYRDSSSPGAILTYLREDGLACAASVLLTA